MVLSS
ncbi:unnamed protein product [Gulo gulo]